MGYKARKEEKFDSIYRAYKNDVYKLSLYYTRDEHAAKDISQKAFIEFYLHMDSVNIECSRGYLFRAVRNLATNLARDNKYRSQEEELEILDEIQRASASVEDAYVKRECEKQKKEFYNSLMEHVRHKNESWYEALHLAYCMEMPQDEVAEELGISKEVLYSRLHRARDWIRKNYEEEYEEVKRRS